MLSQPRHGHAVKIPAIVRPVECVHGQGVGIGRVNGDNQALKICVQVKPALCGVVVDPASGKLRFAVDCRIGPLEDRSTPGQPLHLETDIPAAAGF